jgi:hypothetical protein
MTAQQMDGNRRSRGAAAKIRILEYILENTDTDEMRNTLTRISEKIPDIPTTTMHKYLMRMTSDGILHRDDGEIRSVKNQLMKIFRYSIVPGRVDAIRSLITNFHAGNFGSFL